uniref:CABIT domain-containing protein n=1 Tax=Anopheles albimanus TaxID=7167 RepID=A0A182F1C2_ANOAL
MCSYFSFINDKGAATATIYTTIVQLVRDQVYKFLSLENLAAYTESHDNFSHKAHYVKATAKAGQVYRLLAVFQDGDHKAASSHKDSSGSASDRHVSGREKERGKYAQLLDDNRQIYYVSLSAKGKFYEIEQHSAPVLQKPLVGGGNFGQLNGNLQQQQQGSLTGGSASSSINNPLHRKQAAAPPRHLSRDCVHRIGFIMQSDVSLPVNLRLISPQTGPHSIVPEYVTIAKISEENFIVACPLDEQQLTSTLTLTKLHLAPQMKFSKCTMGFESEQHMLLNPNVQAVLKFCQFNCDNFLRIVDHETNAIELQQMVAMASAAPVAAGGHPTTVNVSPNTTLTTTGPSSLLSSAGGQHREPKSEMLKVFGRLFGGGGGSGGGGNGNGMFGGGHDRHSGSGHEKEDSIIFLSKNDLESLECSGREAIEAEHQHQQQQQQQQQQHLDQHHHHHSLGDRSVRSYDGQGRESGSYQQPHSLPALSASGGFSEKMKVFTPNGGVTGGKKTSSTSRWFKGLGRSVTGGGGHQGNGPVSADDEWDKRTSLDRYKDMSKLIQERFGTLAVSSRAHSDILGGGYGEAGASLSPMSATGTLVSLNPAASTADMTSGGYGSDTLVSGGSGGGSVAGMQKSRSLQHIEHQQQQHQHMTRGQQGRNRPDLVTNLSGSVDGDTIHTFDPDDADRLSELEGDTLIFPLRHASHQQSFMTQKLYNEFHVKTKQHSKSSSSIQQLLHLASGGGPGKALSAKQRASGRQQRNGTEVILSFDDLRYMNSEEAEEAQQERPVRNSSNDAGRRMRQAENRMSAPLPAPPKVLEDDLPYSSVRDSIMVHDDPQLADDGESVPTESIYAEICADHGTTMVSGSTGGEGHSSPTATTSSGCSTGSTGSSSSSSSNGNRMAPSIKGNQHTVTISTGGAGPLRSTEKRFVSIRINVPPCDSIDAGPVSLNPAGGGATVTVRGGSSSNCSSNSSSRCSSTVSSPIEDNIYNTIK